MFSVSMIVVGLIAALVGLAAGWRLGRSRGRPPAARRSPVASPTQVPAPTPTVAAPAAVRPGAPGLVPQELAQAWVQFMRDDVSQSVNSMNNRLNAILAAVRDVPAGSLDHGTQAALEQIRTEVARAVQITSRLLRRADSMAPETAPELLKPLAESATRPAHILLVEDDPVNRVAITRLLGAFGHQVTACENGIEAFGAIQARAVDCIVCDLRMPALGGRSLFEQIEEQYPQLASRFVFVTGDYTNPDSRSFLDHSGQPVVAKPFEVAELVNAVAVILRRVGVLSEASGQRSTSC